jgi:hypothetical protein
MFSQGNIRAFYTSKRAKALTGLPIITNDEPEDVILVAQSVNSWTGQGTKKAPESEAFGSFESYLNLAMRLTAT